MSRVCLVGIVIHVSLGMQGLKHLGKVILYPIRKAKTDIF